MCGAGRTGRRATNSLQGGAYSHLGCRFDCPRGHRGELFRRQAAPGRGAPAGRSQTAAAFACVVRGGPGPAARGRHVAGPRTLGVPLPGRGCLSLRRPRPVSFHPVRHASTRAERTRPCTRCTPAEPRSSPSARLSPDCSRPGGEIIRSPDGRPAASRPTLAPSQTPFCHSFAFSAVQWPSMCAINESSGISIRGDLLRATATRIPFDCMEMRAFMRVSGTPACGKHTSSIDTTC
jgi:hypothetical protein